MVACTPEELERRINFAEMRTLEQDREVKPFYSGRQLGAIFLRLTWIGSSRISGTMTKGATGSLSEMANN